MVGGAGMTDDQRMTRGSEGFGKISPGWRRRDGESAETGSRMGAPGLVSTTSAPLGASPPCFYPGLGGTALRDLLIYGGMPFPASLP